MRLNPPSSISDLRGCDLTLTSRSTLTLTLTKQKVGISFDTAWWEDYDGRQCASISTLQTLLAELWAKNQTLTFGSLTWPLKSSVDLKNKIGTFRTLWHFWQNAIKVLEWAELFVNTSDWYDVIYSGFFTGKVERKNTIRGGHDPRPLPASTPTPDACTDMSVSAQRQDMRQSYWPSERCRVKSAVPAALNVKWLEPQIEKKNKHTHLFSSY